MKTIMKDRANFFADQEVLGYFDRIKKLRPEFAERIKRPGPRVWLALRMLALRKKHNLTQRELAERAGVTFTTVQRIEGAQPHSNPTMDVLERLGGVLKTPVHELVAPVDGKKNGNQK